LISEAVCKGLRRQLREDRVDKEAGERNGKEWHQVIAYIKEE
jgi:hypothetical protein